MARRIIESVYIPFKHLTLVNRTKRERTTPLACVFLSELHTCTNRDLRSDDTVAIEFVEDIDTAWKSPAIDLR